MTLHDKLIGFFGTVYILIGVLITYYLIALKDRIRPIVFKVLKAMGTGFLIAGLLLLVSLLRLI